MIDQTQSSGERLPLSTRQRVVIGVGTLLVVALALACGFVIRQRALDARVELTRKILSESSDVGGLGIVRVRGRPAVIIRQGHSGSFSFGALSRASVDELGGAVKDAWGQPVIGRMPGHVHTSGWDLYSVGPNGVDEEGAGDDIVIGEDFAAAGSAR